jgi:DNA-binding IclR family transcriptional regulator
MQLLGSDPRQRFSLAEISRTLGISRATAHAIMATLTAHDWATRDPQTAGYTSGSAFASLVKPANASSLRGELRDLAASTGTQVFLTERQTNSLVVTDVAGQSLPGRPITRGTRMPLLAPFGRDWVAWSSPEMQDTWLRTIGEPTAMLRERIQAVLEAIRRRDYAVERLTRESVRVFSALLALSGGNDDIDLVTIQLARTLAEQTIIDVLDAEMAPGTSHNIATVAAPVRGPNGEITMSIGAAPFSSLEGPAVQALGEQVRAGAAHIQARIALRNDSKYVENSH